MKMYCNFSTWIFFSFNFTIDFTNLLKKNYNKVGLNLLSTSDELDIGRYGTMNGIKIGVVLCGVGEFFKLYPKKMHNN